MAYGIKVFDSAGAVMLDTTSVPFNQVDSFLLAAGQSFSKTYTGMESYVFSVLKTPAANLPITVIPTPHPVSISGNTVSLGVGSVDEYVLVLAK